MSSFASSADSSVSFALADDPAPVDPRMLAAELEPSPIVDFCKFTALAGLIKEAALSQSCAPALALFVRTAFSDWICPPVDNPPLMAPGSGALGQAPGHSLDIVFVAPRICPCMIFGTRASTTLLTGRF